MLSIIFYITPNLLLIANACTWPTADALFIIDGTRNIGPINYEQMKKFILDCVENMQIGMQDSRVALVEYTPKANYLLNLFTGTVLSRVEDAIKVTVSIIG